MTGPHKEARLYAAAPPTPEQAERLREFLHRTYGEELSLHYEPASVPGGFRLTVGSDVYDWSAQGRLSQLQEQLEKHPCPPGQDPVPLLRQALADFRPVPRPQQQGQVLGVADGIARVTGLPHVAYGEILRFPGGESGMVLDVTETQACCILFGTGSVRGGDPAFPTGRAAGIPVSEAMLGRIVNALGEPLDDRGAPECDVCMPLEAPAPGIRDRAPVNRPLHTGILAVDALFPIGRGQRELIIGDRQTGKTTLAMDAILNQRGQEVVCIYVAIGRKTAEVKRNLSRLFETGADTYTVAVLADAGESAAMQYLAPFAGCAIGEYFMRRGRDVLVVYDDLGSHAVAYRSLSLLLGRPPGREAYPGDIFYLHARLLERAAQLCPRLCGGSLTALPIVQTKQGDIAAYIPTNLISITDGQLFLERELFHAGQRPALNVGLSVSRVGKSAQSPAMRRATGALRLELAQYRERQEIAHLSEEGDAAQNRLGALLTALLVQPAGAPYAEWEQVALLTMALSAPSVLPPGEARPALLQALRRLKAENSALCRRIARTGVLTEEDRVEILRFSPFAKSTKAEEKGGQHV